ncbi:hypothetical protein ACWDKQ_33965 [Saccharopolyspora sp. NPDC000995]
MFRFEPDKFGAAGLRPAPSDLVHPPRVAECPVQLEARATRVQADAAENFRNIEAHVLRVDCGPHLVIPGAHHVDPTEWSPLIYHFRHYFGLGRELGHSFRSKPRGQKRRTPSLRPVVSRARGGALKLRSLPFR